MFHTGSSNGSSYAIRDSLLGEHGDTEDQIVGQAGKAWKCFTERNAVTVESLVLNPNLPVIFIAMAVETRSPVLRLICLNTVPDP